VVWYKDGLRFSCTGCGKCCTGGPGFVWVTLEEATAMADALKMPFHIFKRRFLRTRQNRLCLVERKNGDCIFLEDKKCKLYAVRPMQCRTYPWWKENLNSEESWKKAAEFCEGINPQAPLVTLTAINSSL
jgi:Fe-S-cluster containining protein